MNPENTDEEEPKKGVWVYFLAVFMILLMVAWFIPRYAIKPDPRPGVLPSLKEVRELAGNQTGVGHKNVYDAFDSISAKPVANYIATTACQNGNKICYAKALYKFVQKEIVYINDPLLQEYVEEPIATIAYGGGDCDDGAVLLASMLESIGIKTKFVFKPHHVLVKAWLPEAAKQYKTQGDWVFLEWTCSTCDFGEVPQ